MNNCRVFSCVKKCTKIILLKVSYLLTLESLPSDGVEQSVLFMKQVESVINVFICTAITLLESFLVGNRGVVPGK